MSPHWNHPLDLAPGDLSSKNFNWSGFEIKRIESRSDPHFKLAYEKLWDEFGVKGELETEEVIERRLSWNPSHVNDGYSFLYEMILVLKDGKFAAVRDHTAIVNRLIEPAEACVHLSHALIYPSCRGTGLVGWLRSWPIHTARKCLDPKNGNPKPTSPITLVAEMEPVNPDLPDRVVRLKSYGKAGFLKADPGLIDFYQPDFRPFAEIDASGGAKPLQLRLVMRRVGKENEKILKAAEIKRMVRALYKMYQNEFREKDMKPLWEQLEKSYPHDDVSVQLIDPTKDSP